MAVVMVASPRKSAHSSKPLLDVMISEVFSDMEDTNPKNRFASVGVSGMKPTSSTITRAAFLRYFSLRCFHWHRQCCPGRIPSLWAYRPSSGNSYDRQLPDHRSERSALALSIFISGMGKQEHGHINPGPGSIHILEGGLAEIHLHLLSHGKLGHGLIASGVGMPGKMIFLSEFFYIPRDSPLGMILFVMLFQPIADLCCRKRRIFPKPGKDLVPVSIQIPDTDDLPGIMLVLLHIHVPIPFYGHAVDNQSLCNGTLGKACLPHLMNLAVHVIPLHFVTAFPLEYSHCTRERA